MFTGIIETTGEIIKKTSNTLTIEPKIQLPDLKIGSSIAVDGACLTVTELNDKHFSADVMPITFERTTLGEKKVKQEVNLERAMDYGKRFEGHMVSGHVEGRAKLVKMQIKDNAYHLFFSVDETLTNQIVDTGSIALNGISLTVIRCVGQEFEVGIIPHTWEITDLKYLEIGHKVNVETDMMAKYAKKLMESNS